MDVSKLTAEEVVAVAIEALARARNDLDTVCKVWHREKEDDVLRRCVRNLDVAGEAICLIREGMKGTVEAEPDPNLN